MPFNQIHLEIKVIIMEIKEYIWTKPWLQTASMQFQPSSVQYLESS